MTDKEHRVKEKHRFAKTFIAALQERSCEGMASLLPTFEEYLTVLGVPIIPGDDQRDPASPKYSFVTAEEFEENKIHGPRLIFELHEEQLTKHAAQLATMRPENSNLYGVQASERLAESDAELITVGSIVVRAAPEIAENGDSHTFSIELKNLYFIDGKLAFHEIGEMRCYTNIDPTPRIQPQIEKMGFKEIPAEKYHAVMDGHRFALAKRLSAAGWHLHEGDLTIQPEDAQVFEYGSFIVLGNLTVQGNCDLDTDACLFVLGDMHVDSLFLGTTTFFVSGTIHAKRSVHVHGGSGGPVEIAAIEAPFVYTDSDGYYTHDTNLDGATIVVDYSYDRSKGDPAAVLLDAFMEIEEDEDRAYVDSSEMVRAIKAGEPVFRTDI